MTNISRQALEILNTKNSGGSRVISNKTAAKIAELSAKHITDRLSFTAYEQVVENFCLPRCGHTPDGELCDGAERTHRLFVALLFRSYSKSN